MEKNKISVIMGIYNSRSKEVLEKSLKSILNQTYTNFELIICNDGSTNECMKWAKEICENDKRVNFIENDKNYGLAYTLNHCLREATGEYIARMDDDDYSRIDRFERQINFLENNKEYSLVGSVMNLFDNNGIWGRRNYKEYVQKEDFLYRVAVAHPTILARREAFDIVKGYRDIKHTYRVEDYDCFMRMFARGVKMYNFQEPLLDYREDAFGAKKKKYKYRINEVYVRYNGFKELGLINAKNLIYIIKPLVAGLIPQRAIKYFQRKK